MCVLSNCIVLQQGRSLTFPADTIDEKDKFLKDIGMLVDSIINDGTFRSTEPIFNFYAIFTPSNEVSTKLQAASFATYDAALLAERCWRERRTERVCGFRSLQLHDAHNALISSSTPFGLYRDGHELRALYAAHRKTARQACAAVEAGYFGAQGGGCSQMALVGNFPFYGGLGGEFTSVSLVVASPKMALTAAGAKDHDGEQAEWSSRAASRNWP